MAAKQSGSSYFLIPADKDSDGIPAAPFYHLEGLAREIGYLCDQGEFEAVQNVFEKVDVIKGLVQEYIVKHGRK